MQVRFKGHILNEQSPWRVRIKDPDSSFNGKVISVASVINCTELARGLNVTFQVGTVDQGNRRVLKAVDLRLDEATFR